MATVVSMTEDKIRELLAGWEGVSLSQDEINSLVDQLKNNQDSTMANFDFFNNIVVPMLQADNAANSTAISDVTAVQLPNLEAALEDHQARMDNIQGVDIPAIQEMLDNEVTNSIDRPKVYNQAEPPTNPDDDDRFLVVGDTWFDSDDGNKLRLWDGVMWTTFEIDIPDLSLTVKKFNTSTHMIY